MRLSGSWEAQEEEPGNKSCLRLFLYPTWGCLLQPCYCAPCWSACRGLAQVVKGGVDLERWAGKVQNRESQAEKEALVLSETFLGEVGNVCSALLDERIVVKIQWLPVEFGAPAWVHVKVLAVLPTVTFVPSLQMPTQWGRQIASWWHYRNVILTLWSLERITRAPVL